MLANLYYYRDSHGHEVDMLLQQGRKLIGIEMKSSSTYHVKQFSALDKLAKSSVCMTKLILGNLEKPSYFVKLAFFTCNFVE